MFIYYVYILLCLYIKLCLYIIYVLIGRLSLWSIKMIEKYISSSRSSFKRRGNFEKQREEIYKNDRKVYIVLEILVQEKEQPWKTERRGPPTLRCIAITLKTPLLHEEGLLADSSTIWVAICERFVPCNSLITRLLYPIKLGKAKNELGFCPWVVVCVGSPSNPWTRC